MRSVIMSVLTAGLMVACSPTLFSQVPKTPIKVVGGSIEFHAEHAAGWQKVDCSISGSSPVDCWEAQLGADIPTCVESDGTVISSDNWSCASTTPLTLTADWTLTLTEQNQNVLAAELCRVAKNSPTACSSRIGQQVNLTMPQSYERVIAVGLSHQQFFPDGNGKICYEEACNSTHNKRPDKVVLSVDGTTHTGACGNRKHKGVCHIRFVKP